MDRYLIHLTEQEVKDLAASRWVKRHWKKIAFWAGVVFLYAMLTSILDIGLLWPNWATLLNMSIIVVGSFYGIMRVARAQKRVGKLLVDCSERVDA